MSRSRMYTTPRTNRIRNMSGSRRSRESRSRRRSMSGIRMYTSTRTNRIRSGSRKGAGGAGRSGQEKEQKKSRIIRRMYTNGS
jgi:hypothetical protein